MRVRTTVFGALLALGVFGSAVHAAPSGAVVVIPIHGTVDEGMAHLVQRAIADANESGAKAIVFDVNSPGGLVSAAFEIRDAAFASKVPVTEAYVTGGAYSAAALISLLAQHIVMAPGATIGAAEPIPYSIKMVSALRGTFESIAERNHRDPHIAGAMVDKYVDLPQYKRNGSILTLNTNDALKAHYVDAIAPNLDAALKMERLDGAPRVTAEYTLGEQIARFATDPIVSGLLLTIGMLGLMIEMQTLHGIAGAVGIGAFALFFGTHIYAGFSNGLVIALAILGIIGILWELHVVPGHGIPGILGGVALLAAILLAFGLPFFFVAVETIATSIVLAVICFTLLLRVMPENAFMSKLMLRADQGPEYVTSADFSYLRGQSGTAVSFLRPAGTASISGKRVDVLTEGDFIPAGTPIRVTRVQGARVFVEPSNPSTALQPKES